MIYNTPGKLYITINNFYSYTSKLLENRHNPFPSFDSSFSLEKIKKDKILFFIRKETVLDKIEYVFLYEQKFLFADIIDAKNIKPLYEYYYMNHEYC